MHNRTKLVTEQDFKELSGIVGNFDFEFIAPFVIISQDVDLSQVMGERMLSRLLDGYVLGDLNPLEQKLLDTYVVPTIVQFSLYRGLTNLLFKYDNSGIVKRNSENGTAAELGEVSFMADQAKTLAESYGKRLRDYLLANSGSYPEFKTEFIGEIEPADTPSFTGGMWLGRSSICDVVDTNNQPIPPDDNSISNLRFVGNPGIIETETLVDNPLFDWDATGTPVGLVMSDNQGGSWVVESKPFTLPTHYEFQTPTKVTWTLSGSNVDAIVTSTVWIYPAFWGVSDDGIITTNELLFSNKLLVETAPTYTPHMVVPNSKFGFIAVHKGYTGKIYSTWYIDQYNNGQIGQFDFIKYQGILSYGADEYDVYVWNYASEVNNVIKFE